MCEHSRLTLVASQRGLLKGTKKSRDCLLVRAPDTRSKGCEFESRHERWGEFSSPESTLCPDPLFCVRSTPVLPQWHVKDPGHSAKSAGWQVTPKHAYTRTLNPTKSEWADYAAIQAQCGNPIRKRAHTQLVREHSATVVSAR